MFEPHDRDIDRMKRPTVCSSRATALSPWVSLVTRVVEFPSGESSEYHSLRQADYVAVLAQTSGNEIILVQQFRPTLEACTLELPGGLLEPGQDPAAGAARELEEETGYRLSEPVTELGMLVPDSGRLENRFWCYYAERVEPVAGWRREPGVEPLLMPKAQFVEAIRSGQFTMALHIALVGLAVFQNKFQLV